LPVRIKLPVRRRPAKPVLKNLTFRRSLALAIAVVSLSVVGVLWFSYSKYARLTDEKLAHGPFPKTSLLYASPQVIGIGDPGTPAQMAARLRESGYSEDARSNVNGWYHLRPDAVEIFPGPQAYMTGQPGVVRYEDDKISSIIDLTDNTPRTEYTLDPQLLSSLYDKNREKRRLVHYDEIPPILVHAVISVEDKRFFQHSGFDPFRITRAFFIDLKEHRKAEGASTITQQLAWMLYLDHRKTFSRKFAELMISIHLEQKLTKEKIFEYYANEVDLGRRGSFAIRGFGEASQAYFGKDIRQLTLPEAATLAGLIQEPSYRNPARWPERAKTRRDVVLRLMLENGYITKTQFDEGCEAPMVVTKQGIESTDAPYFLDLVNERLSDDFHDREFLSSGSKIYTTLDPLLQHDAAEAVSIGMRELQETLQKRHKKGTPVEEPQVALICVDPHTGEVKALIGGKNYGQSQLDHALANRPSGSAFKPFVYAAALNTALDEHPGPMTPSSMFSDEPQTFLFDGKPYSPVDYHHNDWKGDVTMRYAFANSLNVPAVEVAQATGYNVVADLAHKAGLSEINATPAMALGAYNVTPLAMTAAYTMFANDGVMVKPRLISRIVDSSDKNIWHSEVESTKILDPRVNFLIVSMMQEVLRTGTGARVHAYGFNLPAAGKTGTSHDAWFAGFTSNLLCVVWVGLDNYQDLKLEGAHAALPIWAEFMTRAHKHREYRDVSDFSIPPGIVSARIDPDSGELATAACPKTQTEYYLAGTQPVQYCPLHQGVSTQIAGWETPASPGVSGASGMPIQPTSNKPPPFPEPAAPATTTAALAPDQGSAPQVPENTKKKKGGVFDKLKSIFR
jgi:penicillin-binding protein 1B